MMCFNDKNICFLNQQDERRNFRFIRNGGHLGAIGGYLFQRY